MALRQQKFKSLRLAEKLARTVPRSSTGKPADGSRNSPISTEMALAASLGLNLLLVGGGVYGYLASGSDGALPHKTVAIEMERASPPRSVADAIAKAELDRTFGKSLKTARHSAVARRRIAAAWEVVASQPRHLSSGESDDIVLRLLGRAWGESEPWTALATPGGVETPTISADLDPKAGEPDGPKPAAARRELSRFNSKLASLADGNSDGPITILHLGDSHISSDAFTRGIRRRLQAKFGNAGRGMVIPAGAYRWAIADGVRLSKSGAWSAANSMKTKFGGFGISGVRLSSASRGAKLKLTSKSGAFDWAEVTVMTGPGQGRIKISAGGVSETVNARAASVGSKVVRVSATAHTLVASPAGGGRTTVLNWAVGRDRPGIRYVNFGLSGATMDVTKRWSKKLVVNDVRHLKPDLIVMGYGTNEGFNDNLDIKAYEARYKKLLALLTDAAPEADVLILGPADSARLPRFARRSGSGSCRALSAVESRNYRSMVRARNGRLARWHAPPKLDAIRVSLRNIAKQTDAGYWDWAQAMGGACSVNKWARSSPKMAARDRVHLTQLGYDRSANAFVGFLIKGMGRDKLVATR